MPALLGAKPVVNPGILYTNNPQTHRSAGTKYPTRAYISYFDGFFTSPGADHPHVTPERGRGPDPRDRPDLGAYTSFIDTSVLTPAVTRELMVTGGFGNNPASNDRRRSFYEFDSSTFPNIPLIRPGSTPSRWRIVNRNNDEHLMHVHVNDFQVMQIVDPVAA